MIKVTQDGENKFTIEWDENDPNEKMFNNWTEEDFINAIQNKLQSLEELGVLDNATEAINQINDHIEEEIIATCEETFGKECYENSEHKDYYEFIDQTAEELFEDISNAEKFIDWYSVKEEAIREYQSDQLKEDGDVPPPDNFPLFP